MSFTAYSEAEITDFLRQQMPALLAHLSPDQVPAWGLMTPQHVLEHLAGAVRLSAGRYNLPAPPAGPALDQALARLQSDAPFPRSVRNPSLPAMPGPLRLPALAAATAELVAGLEEFFDYFSHHPTSAPVHMIFGPLSFEHWRLFHFKHFGHHFLPFGLLKESQLPRAVAQPKARLANSPLFILVTNCFATREYEISGSYGTRVLAQTRGAGQRSRARPL